MTGWSRRHVDAWVEAYARAWREKDADAVRQLFTPDASYRSSPTKPAHAGRDAIASYWRRATSTQEGLDLRFGVPVIDGSRAAVEWWAVMRDPGWRPDASSAWVTLPGCLVIVFDASGLCCELREYYNPLFGQPLPPPDGWGR